MLILENTYLFKYFFLGCIEGIIEFIPISSTAHIILISKIFNIFLSQIKPSEIFIQIGPVVAVIFFFYKKILYLILNIINKKIIEIKLICNIFISIISTLIISFFFLKTFKLKFYKQNILIFSLIAGGFLITYTEMNQNLFSKNDFYYNEIIYRNKLINYITMINWKQSLLIGLFQFLSIIPGISRSGISIIIGVVFGINKRESTEFSFLLLIPIIVSASCHEMYYITINDVNFFSIFLGFLGSFMFSLATLSIIINFVSKYNYKIFAFYRIILGTIIIIKLIYSY